MAPHTDIGTRNRNLVLAQIFRHPAISRSAIGEQLQLNAASVSRITRDLIDARLVKETGLAETERRPGRRFVGLSANGSGGYVIGIGLNAFRQSVTLANLENVKIAEWVSPHAPGKDGNGFMRLCIDKAAKMITTHVADRKRLFGVGIAVAANLDKRANVIVGAQTFGWTEPIPVGELIGDKLGTPLVIEVPSLSINMSEAEFGIGRDVGNVTTLHCSLGFGIGVRKQESNGTRLDFGRVLTRALAPDGSGRKLDALCGGISVLNEVIGVEKVAQKSDTELGKVLADLIALSSQKPELAALLAQKGRTTAHCISLTLDLVRPELLLLAGPLASSPEFVAGFRDALQEVIGATGPLPDVSSSTLTPTGASRLLALGALVAKGNLDLNALKRKDAA